MAGTVSYSVATPATTKIGWIGCGIMGKWMCQHAMEAGYKATVYNRTKEKCQPLIELGATYADSPSEVAAKSDVVFLIVGFPKDVEEVIDGKNGVLSGIEDGKIIVDMTTSEPTLAAQLAKKAKLRNIALMDAPVSGGDVGAKNGTLSIMCGGEQAAFDAVMPLFNCMGKSIRYTGVAGTGQHTKMTNQILIATNIIGTVEALLYAQKAGLNVETTLAAVAGGAAGSWSLSNYWPRMIKDNLEPGFMIEHFVKDMGIALHESKLMNISLPGLELSHQLYTDCITQGLGKKGIQAFLASLKKINEQK